VSEIRTYLSGLLALCREVRRNPELLPDFLQIVARVPATVTELLAHS
jgi:hypothetical protein